MAIRKNNGKISTTFTTAKKTIHMMKSYYSQRFVYQTKLTKHGLTLITCDTQNTKIEVKDFRSK